MNERVKKLTDEASALTPDERAELIDGILCLDAPDPAIDAAWAAEAQRRLAAWRRGELPSIPAEEVFAKYFKP